MAVLGEYDAVLSRGLVSAHTPWSEPVAISRSCPGLESPAMMRGLRSHVPPCYVENMNTIDGDRGLRREHQRWAKAREEAAKLREVQRLRDAEGKTIQEALEAVGDPMPHSSFHVAWTGSGSKVRKALWTSGYRAPSKVTPAIIGFLSEWRSQPNCRRRTYSSRAGAVRGYFLPGGRFKASTGRGVARPRASAGTRREEGENRGPRATDLKVVDDIDTREVARATQGRPFCSRTGAGAP